MKDMISEKLVMLATAQERMANVVDMIEQLDNSQLFLEKSAYDSMNASDKILNLSKEGNQMIEKLQAYFSVSHAVTAEDEAQKMKALSQEVQFLFYTILSNASQANEIAHHLEAEVAYQREIGDHIKDSVSEIGEIVDSATACAEILLAEY